MLLKRLTCYAHHIGHLPRYIKKFGFVAMLHRCWEFLFRFGSLHLPGRKIKTPLHPMLLEQVGSETTRLLSPKVLIVAELSIPQCTHYRVKQKVQMLQAAGYETAVVSWIESDTKGLQELQTSTLVIFYRVPYAPLVAALYAEARRLGLKVGYDIDDLVFDVEEYAKNSNLLSLPKAEQSQLLNGARLYCQALSAADFSIASTPRLATFMAKYCKGANYLVPNGLDAADDAEGPAGAFRFPLGLDGKVVLGYGSGTSTHNADFALCANAVLRILKEFENTVLVIHGLLELPEAFKALEERIVRVAFVPFADYSNAVARFDVNLIPLEPGLFNDCKSNIKYLEASRLGVCSVASPCAEFSSVIADGENGFLADGEEAWYEALRKLVASKPLRQKIGAAARETVLARFSPEAIFNAGFRQLLADDLPKKVPARRRIMVVNVLYPPTSFGGATIVAENLVAEYAKNLDVCVFSLTMEVRHRPGFIYRYENRGELCFLVEVPVPDDPNDNWRSPDVAEAFARVAKAFRPDVVHFNSIQFLGIEMLAWCRDKRIPYFVTAHDAWWLCPRQFMLDAKSKFCAQDALGIDLYRCAACTQAKTLFTRWKDLHRALSAASFVLTPSDYQRRLYEKAGFPNGFVITNPNGIAVPKSVKPHTRQRVLTFAYFGGKCEHKGYFFLKRLASTLHGEFKLKLIDLNLKFGVAMIRADEWPDESKVEVCKPFDHHDMDAFYESIDVLLFPSCMKESFGLTIREALARNVWVIATDAGGDIARDLKDGENGNLVPLFDETAFAAAMQRLIDNPKTLDGYENPYRDKIVTPQQQAAEIVALLSERTFQSQAS